jgi:hypothetical protein
MFNAKYDNPLDSFILNNPVFSRTDLENHLESLGIYTGKTPDRSINRDVLKYLRKNFPEFEKLTTKEVKKTKDENVPTTPRDIVIPPVWYKKLLKTGTTTNPQSGKTSLKIEIFTFEKNDKCRFDSLLQAVIKEVPEVQYINDTGYSSTMENPFGDDPEFEAAKLTVESSDNNEFFNGIVELTDTNESPC